MVQYHRVSSDKYRNHRLHMNLRSVFSSANPPVYCKTIPRCDIILKYILCLTLPLDSGGDIMYNFYYGYLIKQRCKMNKNAYGQKTAYFLLLSRMTLTLLTFTCFYIFCFTAGMTENIQSAIEAYHAVGYMAEHVIAGIIAYLAFALIFTKVFSSSMYD